MTENDLVELYCTIDDFYQCFIKTEPGKKNLAEYYGKRGPRRSMTVPEVMTLNIVRILDRTGDLKTFHKTACLHYRSYFPNLTNYENFMKASNKAVGFIAAFIQVQLYLNQENCNENTFFLDSTPVTVFENRYISSHKVANAIASRGKSTALDVEPYLLFKPEKYNYNNKIEEISKKIMETMESEIKKVLSEEL